MHMIPLIRVSMRTSNEEHDWNGTVTETFEFSSTKWSQKFLSPARTRLSPLLSYRISNRKTYTSYDRLRVMTKLIIVGLF